jgi:hypothetical protein
MVKALANAEAGPNYIDSRNKQTKKNQYGLTTLGVDTTHNVTKIHPLVFALSHAGLRVINK